ncbi:MAG TPA: alpha-galactosidase, partial [Solibacterales bacterium]|nr:alpha-galactosidase [Bryobacterales bacterium]
CAAAIAAVTPASAQFLADRKVWLLQTEHTTYAMGVNSRGELQHLYWGARLWRADDLPNAVPVRDISSFDPSATRTPEEYPAWGGARFYEPALKITRADGDRDVVLHYVSQREQPDGVDIELKDIDDDIFVTLRYRVFQKEDIVSRQSVIENRSKQRV